MWDERYSGAEYVYGTEPNDFLREQTGQIQALGLLPLRILCLAEGEGRNAVYLAGLGHQVTAVDLSEVGLGKARALAHARGVNIETVCADLTRYQPPARRYDAVIMIFCHLPSAARPFLYEQVRSALKPGGLIVAEAYTAAQLALKTGGPGNADFMLSSAELAEAFKGYDIVVNRECQRNIHEGLFHTGLGAVVQFAARKAK